MTIKLVPIKIVLMVAFAVRLVFIAGTLDEHSGCSLWLLVFDGAFYRKDYGLMLEPERAFCRGWWSVL